MPRLTEACLDAIRQRADLLELAQSYTAMKRVGAQWRGLSPFNAEKTPSFYVHPEKNLFMDYSSGQGGDAFRFLELKENLTFMEAAETLARRYGVPLEYEDSGGSGPREDPSLRSEILRLHEIAGGFFARHFHADDADGDIIRRYWSQQRGFTVEQAREYGIGFAPADPQALFREVQKERFSREALEQCGLFFIWENDAQLRRVRCRFRGRLMIPIHDVQGRLCAFTARKTDLSPDDDPQREAKYINSPETPVFTKGRVLFNLHRARVAIQEAKSFLLVEGQLDALRCHSAGLKATVAPQGSAVTPEQLALLRRYTRNLEVLLDGDRAGRDAAFKLLPKALAAGIDVTFLPLPEGVDPDDLVRDGGAEALRALRDRRLSAMELAVRHLMPEPGQLMPQEKASALEQIYRMLAEVESHFARGEMLAQVARLVGSSYEQLQRDAARIWDRPTRPPSRAPATEAPTRGANPHGASANGAPAALGIAGGKVLSAEEELLILSFAGEECLTAVAADLDPAWPDASTAAGRLLAQLLLDVQEGVWEGSAEFLEHLEDAELKNYARQLTQMGATLLDFRCDGGFLRRGGSPVAAKSLAWEPSDTIAILIKGLRRRFVDRQLRRLDEQFLNTPEEDRDRRREVLQEKQRLRKTL
ncbi:MAG: DNA primase [Opitutales bacterium]